MDGVDETLRAPLPAVVSVTDQLNEPRFPGFKDLKAARAKPLVQAELDTGDGGTRLAEFIEEKMK